MSANTLLAVPNVSEGRDREALAQIAAAFAGEDDPRCGRPGVRLLDVHTDRDHHRTVFTLAGPPGALADALVRGARAAVDLVDVMARARGPAQEVGQHPHVGTVDVAPIVYLDPQRRGLACAQALVLGDRLAEELGVPVFLYGELTGIGETASEAVPARDVPTGAERSTAGAGRVGAPGPGAWRTRAELRRGGIAGLAARLTGAGGDGERLLPDFGPPRLHERAGATLLAARPPLVAFNLRLAPPATLAQARSIAAEVREGGASGVPGLRAIAVELEGGRAQVSMNVERPYELPLARVVEAVRAHAPLASAELVGLAPAVAFEGFPGDLPIPGFDPARHLIENALKALSC